jgi:hypothetical protein
MADNGPVQLVAIGFGPEANFEGRIMEELGKLEQHGTIRILDLLFVRREPDSDDVVVLDLQDHELGGIVGALLGFEFDGADTPPPADWGSGEHAFGLTRDDVVQLAAGLEPGHAAGFLLMEHLWARDFRRAVEDAGGVPLAEGFLTPDAIAQVAPELSGMAEALDEVSAEEGS